MSGLCLFYIRSMSAPYPVHTDSKRMDLEKTREQAVLFIGRTGNRHAGKERYAPQLPFLLIILSRLQIYSDKTRL